MTQNQDPLLEICKPYLLDLITAVTESLKYPDAPQNESEKVTLRLNQIDHNNIYDLTEIQKIKLMSDISTWLLEGERPNK